jgi:hypothetical protein
MSYSFREAFLDLIYAIQTVFAVIIAGLCSDAQHTLARTTSGYVNLDLI